MSIDQNTIAGDSHQATTFHALPVVDAMKPTPAMDAMAGIGDINGTAKGSGARYNAGKTPYILVPLRLVGESHLARVGLTEQQRRAALALICLGDFQARARGREALIESLSVLGLEEGWEECARVFEYGAKKYAAHNWCRGMKWSVCIECAARHLEAILKGENSDQDKPGAPGSHLPHRGHYFCNAVMLLSYLTTFSEGDDRPPAGLFPVAANDGALQVVA